MIRTAKIFDWSDEGWRFAFVRDALPPDIYAALAGGLNTIEWRKASTEFYTQYEANLATSEYFRTVLSPARLAGMRGLVENFFDCELERKIDVSAHKLVCGDQIGIHSDRNSLGETHRLTVHLNPDWDQERGGVLVVFRRRDPATATHAWLPRANTGFLFEIGSRSFHAVTTVQGDAPRYSMVLTFRAKRPAVTAVVPPKRWLPFPMVSDLDTASLECERLGLDARALRGDFRYATPDEMHGLAAEQSCRGAQYAPRENRLLAPIIAVQLGDGRLVVVEGVRRLPLVGGRINDARVVVFRQHRA